MGPLWSATARMGPYEAVDSLHHWQQWAHSKTSTAFLIIDTAPPSKNGPIRCYRQIVLWARIGPFKVIGNFSHEYEWAHSRLSVLFFMSEHGPIRSYRQMFLRVWIGPFEATGNLSQSKLLSNEQEWPTQCHRQLFLNWPIRSDSQFFSWERMGPFKAIGNFSHEYEWACCCTRW